MTDRTLSADKVKAWAVRTADPDGTVHMLDVFKAIDSGQLDAAPECPNCKEGKSDEE